MSEIEQLAIVVEKKSHRDFTPPEQSMADDLEAMLRNYAGLMGEGGRSAVLCRDLWRDKIAPRLDALIRGRAFGYIFDGKHPLTLRHIERITGGNNGKAN